MTNASGTLDLSCFVKRRDDGLAEMDLAIEGIGRMPEIDVVEAAALSGLIERCLRRRRPS